MTAERHISDDLPLLLTGDANRDVVMAAAQHLRSCVDCQQELVSAVIAHASLTSAHRFAREIVTADSPADSAVATHGQGGADLPVPGPLPDMSRLFADIRADGPGRSGAEGPAARPGRARRRLLAVAAAAVVAGGGITTYALVTGNDSSGPVTRTVALEGTTDGSDGVVRLVDSSRMIIDGSNLPKLSPGHQYEVWLTANGTRQPVGYLRNGAADIRVPGEVMSRYKGIAVSVQRAGQTEFSGNVVLNGTYG